MVQQDESRESGRGRTLEGWRAGKPSEDPEKLKRWGRVSARPSEYLIHMRVGKVRPASSGQGASCFKLPSDAVAVVPTTVQKLRFSADQVTREKVGVEVTGLAVYRIAEPLIAFRMLNFSFPERAQQKLEEMLVEMFAGAARRLVANLSVDECLSRRKEGIATELMREIAPVVSGRGRPDDETDMGWGVVLDTIEIQDVRILSSAVFSNMQARYRQTQELEAREAALTTERAVKLGEAEATRRIELTHLAAKTEVQKRRQESEERAIAEAELAIAEIATRQAILAQEPELSRAREVRAIENAVSPEAIQLVLAQRLPDLAAAFQQNMGQVHVTAVGGENPFGFIVAAVDGVLGMARAAGLELPSAKPSAPAS